MTIITIDPGASGGIAWKSDHGHVAAEPMPDTETEILDLITSIIEGSEGCVAYVEKVGGFTGGRPQPGSRMFTFGQGYGFIRGIIRTRKIRLIEVQPKEWQATLHLGGTGSTKGDADKVRSAKKRAWKNKLKEEAQRRHPKIKVTLLTADALLILEHARQFPN